jgi:TP901 family phage tail tape measure protein
MPVIDFTVEAGNAFSVLDRFYQQLGKGALALEHMAVNFTKINGKGEEYVTSISGVTDTNQKLTASVQKTAKGVEVLNLKLTELPKTAAAAKKAMKDALKINEAKTARGVLESSFPAAELSRDQADAMRSRISQITSAIERGNVKLDQFQNAVAASTGKLAAGSLSETEQKILNIIKRIETAQEKAKALAAKPTKGGSTVSPAAGLVRLADAKTARNTLEGAFPANGLSRDQADAMRARISQITGAIERGNVKLDQFQNAVAASTGKLAVGSLNETEQKILNIIKRIETAQEKATAKARQQLDKQRTLTGNERFGAATGVRLSRQFASQLELLNPASQERVRRQFEQIQGLFSKGLDKTGYARALAAMQSGTTGTLSKIEAEFRHRMERINVEIGRVGKKGFLNRLFGGGSGGGPGVVEGAGGPNKVIGGLLLAQGIDQAAETIKAAATNTADFQKQIALLRTLSQDTAESFDKWEASILRVSNAVGKSKEEIAASGYDLLSNQITKGVADTETALTKVSRFAVATNSSVNDSVNLLSSIINSFGLDVSHTDDILGKMFTTIDLGRIKASDLANTMGRPAVAAKSLGISFEELDAAMITISQTGLGVEQTNTLITNFFHKLLNPTKELQKHFDDIGVSTGEMYVKQLGLVGVLEDLIKATGGSSAAMSEFFNEIRGEQASNQLTSRIEVLKDALKKLQENKTYGGALSEFTNLPGQRFYQEIESYSNAFLKFKDIALKALLDITDSVGGLSNALVIGTYFATGLGVTVGGLYAVHIFDTMAGEAGTLAAVLTKLGPLLRGAGVIGIGIGIGTGLGTLLADYENAKNAAEILSEEGKAAVEGQSALVVAANLKMAQSNENALKKMQSDALAYVTKVKLALGNLAESQKAAFKTVADELKDSFELVGQALKRVITSGEERERKLVDSIAKRRERLRDTKSKAGDDLYEARLATNKVRVGLGGEDREGRIQKQRISELVAEARKLSRSSNPENIERALETIEKAQGIAQERRTATKSVPLFVGGENVGTIEIMKYVDGNRMANDLIRIRRQLIESATKAQEVALEKQRQQNEVDREESKKLQNAANKVTGFKLTDETGKLNFASPEKAIEERERLIKEYQDQAAAVAGSQNVTPAAALSVAKTLADLRQQTNAQLATYREINNIQIETYRNQEAARKKGEETDKVFQGQIAKVKDLNKEMDEATKEQEKFKNAATASFKALEANASRGTLGGIGKFFSNLTDFDNLGNVKGLTPTDLANKIPVPVQDLLKSANTAVEKGDVEGALGLMDQATAKLKELGATEETLLDKQGKTSTVGEFFKKLRVELSLLLNAEERFKAAGIVSDNQVAQGGRMVEMLNKFSTSYGSVSAAAEKFATVSETSFQAVNREANQMVSSLSTALQQLQALTVVAENLRGATNELRQGVSPSLAEPRKAPEKELVGPLPYLFGGPVGHFAEGGFMHDFASGRYARGSDRNPAMLADGESVNNQRATSRFAAQIIAMNAGFEPSFAGAKRGESGQQYTFGDIHVHTKGGDSAAKTTREIGAAMKREIRRGSLNL